MVQAADIIEGMGLPTPFGLSWKTRWGMLPFQWLVIGAVQEWEKQALPSGGPNLCNCWCT